MVRLTNHWIQTSSIMIPVYNHFYKCSLNDDLMAILYCPTLHKAHCLIVLTCPTMCLIPGHRDDLQHGPVLCHQEQQGGYLEVESHPTSEPTTPSMTPLSLRQLNKDGKPQSYSLVHTNLVGEFSEYHKERIQYIPVVHGPKCNTIRWILICTPQLHQHWVKMICFPVL